MSAIESRRPQESVGDLARRSGVVETKRRNEQLTPAERVKRSLVYSGILGRGLERMLERERPKAELEKMSEVAMVLRRGEELGRVSISDGKKGRNAIDMRHYVLEDSPESEYVVAFVKSDGGQQRITFHEETREVTGYIYNYEERGTGTEVAYVRSKNNADLHPKEAKAIADSWGNVAGLHASMAEHYGLSVDDIPKPDARELTQRSFIPPDQLLRAERVAFLHAEFFGLGGVPVTELRAQERVVGATGDLIAELCSVQQMVSSKDAPMEPISNARLDELEASTSGHPLQESFVRLAVMHCLAGQTDGHANNVLAPGGQSEKEPSPAQAAVYGIDFGLAYPMAVRVEEIKDRKGRTWQIDQLAHAHLSYPEYVLENSPAWLLDPRAQESIRARVEACRTWMEAYDRDPNARDMDESSPEVTFLLNSFLFLRGFHLEKNSRKKEILMKIAKRDMRGQLNMAAYIAANGRPPDLKYYGLSNNLWFDMAKREEKASADAKERQTGVARVGARKSGEKKLKPQRSSEIDVLAKTVFHTGENPFSR